MLLVSHQVWVVLHWSFSSAIAVHPLATRYPRSMYQCCWSGIRWHFYSWIGDRFFSGSHTYICESLVTVFWAKSTIIICVTYSLTLSCRYLFKNKIMFNFVIFVATKKSKTTIFSFLICCCCWIRDPRSRMEKYQDPDPQQRYRTYLTNRSWFSFGAKKQAKDERFFSHLINITQQKKQPAIQN